MTDETKVNGEVVDERTGEIIPIGDIPKPQSNTLATTLDLTKAGTLVLDEKADAVFSEPINPEDVQIRPDGLVYLPWTWYAGRLNRALGRLQWALLPQAGAQKIPMGNSELVVWGHWFVVRGVVVGFEYGECTYRPDNFTMSFGDAAAGAKSNSLARNCKMLGMSLELWNQEWVSAWKEKYAERVRNPNGNRPEFIWRKKAKKDNDKQENGKSPAQQAVEHTEPAGTKVEEVKATPTTTEEPKFIWAEVKNSKRVALVKEIAKKSGKKDSEVAVMLGSLEKGVAYSVTELVNKLKGTENVAQ